MLEEVVCRIARTVKDKSVRACRNDLRNQQKANSFRKSVNLNKLSKN